MNVSLVVHGRLFFPTLLLRVVKDLLKCLLEVEIFVAMGLVIHGRLKLPLEIEIIFLGRFIHNILELPFEVERIVLNLICIEVSQVESFLLGRLRQQCSLPSLRGGRGGGHT